MQTEEGDGTVLVESARVLGAAFEASACSREGFAGPAVAHDHRPRRELL
jgi:hypothetical protein